MTERISLINEIKSGGYEASLITTFNAYLPFYEDVVLRHLMGSGIRHNVLMMDATQVSIAVDQHPPYAAGRFYTLAPIKVGGAFHPKIILLVGKNKGTLLVGSHNLTLSGFGYNRELTNLIRCKGAEDSEGAALLASAWGGILDWVEFQSTTLPSHLLAMIRKVGEFAPWLQVKNDAVPNQCRVLSTGQDAGSLWRQLADFVGTEPVHRVTINGAFFDANLAFLAKIQEELAPAEFYVGVDPNTVQMSARKSLPGMSLQNCSGLGATDPGGKHAGYLHAKSILIERQDGETILAVGSANPSYPAWLATGLSENVEMMIARKGAEARTVAEDLGLMRLDSMPPLNGDDWQQIESNWRRQEVFEGASGKNAQVIIALASETDIRFRISGGLLPAKIECELFVDAHNQPVIRSAALVEEEYILSTLDVSVPASRLRFAFADRTFTGLIQHVKQMEGLSRTTAQRRFNEALDSLSSGAPNLDQFVECVKDIIRLSDSVPTQKGALKQVGTQCRDHSADTQKEGAELSVSQQEVTEQEACRKKRMRGSDDLAYLLDVLLFHLRDETPAGVDDTFEDRDAMGRSEEEQVDADDDELVTELPQADPAQPSATMHRDPLQVCHAKVGSLVDAACDRLTALSQGKIPLEQLVVILAGILAALRLLRGLEGKVPWIGAGQTAFPPKERRKLFIKITETLYDGKMSIVNLDIQYSHLNEVEEFSRVKGLIIWLAAESDIQFADKKPFNETLEECHARRLMNRLYVGTAQMIGGDQDIFQEARQSIGQLSLSKLEWLEKLQMLDDFIRDLYLKHGCLKDGGHAKAGDFGFNLAKPELGVREILPCGRDKVALSFHGSPEPKFILPNTSVRTISFGSILRTLKK